MDIEELLTKYTDLAHKRDEVYRSFENQIYSLVYDNEVPIELKDIEGNPTGFTITTPDDLWKASPGMVIAVGGVEWLCCTDKWISCYGATMDDDEHPAQSRPHPSGSQGVLIIMAIKQKNARV